MSGTSTRPLQLVYLRDRYSTLDFCIKPTFDVEEIYIGLVSISKGTVVADKTYTGTFRKDTAYNFILSAPDKSDPFNWDCTITIACYSYTGGTKYTNEQFKYKLTTYTDAASCASSISIEEVKGTSVKFIYSGDNPYYEGIINTYGLYSVTKLDEYSSNWVKFNRPTNKEISQEFTIKNLEPDTTYKLESWAQSYGSGDKNAYGLIYLTFFHTGQNELTITRNNEGALRSASVYYNDGGTIKRVIEAYKNEGGVIKQIENT